MTDLDRIQEELIYYKCRCHKLEKALYDIQTLGTGTQQCMQNIVSKAKTALADVITA